MSAPHFNRRHYRGRQLRLERCEDRALLSGDAVLGDVIVPVDTLTLTYDSAYIAQDRFSISVGGMNFYDLNATVARFSDAGLLTNTLRGANTSVSSIWTSDALSDGGYNAVNWSLGSTGVAHGTSGAGLKAGDAYDHDLDFTGADDNTGVLISPQIPIIPSKEETVSTPPSPAGIANNGQSDVTPAETISLASVLRSEPVARQSAVTQVAQATPAWNAALEKPAFLQRERSAALAPEAIETLDRAFALEGLELDANSPAVESHSDATDAAHSHQPPRASVRSIGERPAVTQTSFTIPMLQTSADASASDEQSTAFSASDELVEAAPPTWPAYLMSKARQTGLALTLGTVAIAIRLRWQRAEQEEPQRSPARKYPNA